MSSAPADSDSHRSRRIRSWVGIVLIAAGLTSLAWSAVVVLWEDPVTSVYTAYRQHSLADAYDEQVRSWELHRPPATPTKPATPPTTPNRSNGSASRGPGGSTASNRPSAPAVRLGRKLGPLELERAAARYHDVTRPGDAIARLTIPRLGVNAVVVNGTDTGDLRSGPGRHLETFMPGEGRLVYIAGHRTTFGAPFSRIDRLVEGDEVRVSVPYATLLYRVTTHAIVDDNDLSVLDPGHRERLALQACHPRFFASHRYIVWARLAEAREPVSS